MMVTTGNMIIAYLSSAMPAENLRSPTLNQSMVKVKRAGSPIKDIKTREAEIALSNISKGAVIEATHEYRRVIIIEIINEINGRNSASSVQLLIQIYAGVPSTISLLIHLFRQVPKFDNIDRCGVQ